MYKRQVLYLAFRKQDQRLIGIIQIRCKLNDYLLNFGGHIGDSIRPSERNKGYSTKMIALALKEAKKLGIGNVLMTCNKNNLASARTIIKKDVYKRQSLYFMRATISLRLCPLPESSYGMSKEIRSIS